MKNKAVFCFWITSHKLCVVLLFKISVNLQKRMWKILSSLGNNTSNTNIFVNQGPCHLIRALQRSKSLIQNCQWMLQFASKVPAGLKEHQTIRWIWERPEFTQGTIQPQSPKSIDLVSLRRVTLVKVSGLGSTLTMPGRYHITCRHNVLDLGRNGSHVYLSVSLSKMGSRHFMMLFFCMMMHEIAASSQSKWCQIGC